MQLRTQLLQHLADGAFHSGERLGTLLGVSRMAVWKHLQTLQMLGVPIETVRGKGYRMMLPCGLLDREEILAGLSVSARSRVAEIDLLLETTSTSSYLRDRAVQGAASGTVCLAEMQTAGRGRTGRRWISPFAGNLYLSLLWRTSLGVAALGGLSLATGIAVLRALDACGVQQIGLKWPNDLLVGDAKLAGILIDVIGEATGPCTIILGVGINVRMPADAAAGIDREWTDLASLSAMESPDRNRLAAAVIDQLFEVLDDFERHGLAPFVAEWGRHDVLAGRRIELQLAHRQVSGIARGIDPSGALVLESESGVQQRYTSGEVSVRMNP